MSKWTALPSSRWETEGSRLGQRGLTSLLCPCLWEVGSFLSTHRPVPVSKAIVCWYQGKVPKKAHFSEGKPNEHLLQRHSVPSCSLDQPFTRTLCRSKGRTWHWPRLSIPLCEKTQGVMATCVIVCCNVTGGLACVPWRISPWGLNSEVLPHVQAYARDMGLMWLGMNQVSFIDSYSTVKLCSVKHK